MCSFHVIVFRPPCPWSGAVDPLFLHYTYILQESRLLPSWPLSCMKVFSYDLISCRNISIIVTVISKTNNVVIWLNTVWIGYEFWKFHVPAFQFTTELQQSHMPYLKGFKVLVCFSQPMCPMKNKHYIIINLWNRISTSQATFTDSFDLVLLVFGSGFEMCLVYIIDSAGKQPLKWNKSEKEKKK